jgi:hypothetical protein
LRALCDAVVATGRVYERGYERNDIIHLFRFLDWLVRLPPELDGRFEAWISDYEKRKTMPYVTSIERIGRKRGRREGLQEGLVEAVEAVLEARFGRNGVLLLSNIELPRDSRSLRGLRRDLLDAQDLSEAAARIGKVASRAGRRR